MRKLHSESNAMATDAIVDTAISCLLRMPLQGTPLCYDRKYSYLVYPAPQCFVESLFPLVEEVYRALYWDRWTRYVDRNEALLLQVAGLPVTTNDTRGRIFEALVIARFRKDGISGANLKSITCDGEDLQLENVIDGNVAPEASGWDGGNMYPPIGLCFHNLQVPCSPTFPAADAMLSVSREVAVVFQIHVSAGHADVSEMLESCAKKAGWFESGVEKIVLVYLSPNEAVMNGLRSRLTSSSTSSTRVIPVFCSIDQFESLRTIQWSQCTG